MAVLATTQSTTIKNTDSLIQEEIERTEDRKQTGIGSRSEVNQEDLNVEGREGGWRKMKHIRGT